MQIPDHLVELVRQLAAANLLQAAGDLRTIEAIPSSDLEISRRARVRLSQAGELVAHIGRPERAAA